MQSFPFSYCLMCCRNFKTDPGVEFVTFPFSGLLEPLFAFLNLLSVSHSGDRCSGRTGSTWRLLGGCGRQRHLLAGGSFHPQISRHFVMSCWAGPVILEVSFKCGPVVLEDLGPQQLFGFVMSSQRSENSGAKQSQDGMLISTLAIPCLVV